MRLTLVTAPTVEPVDLPQAKLHLRVDTDQVDEDEHIENLIVSAREHVEHITGRALLTQTWDAHLDAWPSVSYIKLPFGNLQNDATAVPSTAPSVKWKDDDGTETTLTVATDYLVETNGTGLGRIVLPYAVTWPSGTLYPSNPITVRFVCGWTTAALVPYTIKAAILMEIADLYENREAQLAGNMTQVYSQNKTVAALLTDHFLWEMR